MQSSNDCMLKSFSFSYLDGETSLCMLIRKLFWKVWNIYKLMIQSILAGVIFVSLLVHQINSKSPLQIIHSTGEYYNVFLFTLLWVYRVAMCVILSQRKSWWQGLSTETKVWWGSCSSSPGEIEKQKELCQLARYCLNKKLPLLCTSSLARPS